MRITIHFLYKLCYWLLNETFLSTSCPDEFVQLSSKERGCHLAEKLSTTFAANAVVN